MKRPRKNLGSLIKQEIVSRFEGVVKNEIDEFNHSKGSTDNRLAKLEAELLAVKSEIKNIREEAKNKCDKVVDIFIAEKKALEESFEEQRRYMKTNVLECQKLIKQANDCIDQFVKKEYMVFVLYNLGKDMEALNAAQHKTQTETNNLIENRKDESLAYTDTKYDEIVEHFSQVCKCLDGYENRLKEYLVNNNGVSMELSAYKKHVFILQKQVEDLYNQLDRLKGR